MSRGGQMPPPLKETLLWYNKHIPSSRASYLHVKYSHIHDVHPPPSLTNSLPPPPQDQYDKVAIHTDVGIEFIKRASTFVEKRISAEQNYAKELRRLAKSFRKKDEEESK